MNDRTTLTQTTPRVAKGSHPVFFDAPALEALHGMLIVLLEESCVLRDRLDTYEILGQQGVAVTPETVEAFELDAATEARREQRRQDLIARTMRPVIALQEAAVQQAQKQYQKKAREIGGQDI